MNCDPPVRVGCVCAGCPLEADSAAVAEAAGMCTVHAEVWRSFATWMRGPVHARQWASRFDLDAAALLDYR